MPGKKEFRIPNWTSFDDVTIWECDQGDEVEFRVKRDSGFQLFAGGLAIGAVQRLRSKASKITVKAEFSFPTQLLDVTIRDWPSFFLTLPGIAVLHSADYVTDSSGADLSAKAFDLTWRAFLLKSAGIIGDGKSQNLICREFDSPIPEAVRSSENNKIPSRKEFESVLSNLGRELGAGSRFFGSVTEAGVAGFLFEAFRNAIEHAQPDNEGIWGVSIEKMLLQANDGLQKRKQIPDILTEFIRRHPAKRDTLWICVSVADFGLGIHATLPRLENEGEWPRLLRAFERGVSRKPKSGSPNRGQGLPNILDDAKRLGACVFVNSTGLAGFYDAVDRKPTWTEIKIPSGIRGTSISIFWPVTDGNPDQGKLTLGF